MSTRLKIAVTADLHWGHRQGSVATRVLVDFVRTNVPDVLILAGDIGTGVMFEDCLTLFKDIPCVKALVPGNHDLWVSGDVGWDSLDLYERLLPEASARQGFHDLDTGPLVLSKDLALVGTINWYDYSWGIDAIRRLYPGEEHRLQSKRFTRGKHNDGNFVRWPIDDVSFTSLVTATFERHIECAKSEASRLIAVAHHPPMFELSFPRDGWTGELDEYLWDSFGGNVGVEQVLARHADRITHVFCGHTHRRRRATLGGIDGHNVGSDYPDKRLLVLTWPDGGIEEHHFAAPE